MEEKKNRIYTTIMLVILTSFTTFMITFLSMYSHFENKSVGNTINLGLTDLLSKTSEGNSSLDHCCKRIKSTIEKYYLWTEEIDEEKLKQSAIEGYVAGLGDEYTEYIPADEMKDYTEEINGNFVGIGIYMVADEEANKVVVYYPIPGSPAEKAGIKSGDYIISVDGKEYTSDDFKIISNYIKGEEGTEVKLIIERNGERIPFNVIREKITVNPITVKLINDDIGYIKIQSFDEDTAKDFKNKTEEIINQGAKSIIIDLRNNGGGIVDEATKIADYLLDKEKVIMSTIDNKNNKQVTYSKEDPIFTLPVVLLTNENTASASEILVCSLQENGRAKSVGITTYGKGVIQTVLSLTDGSGLKITTQEYYTPDGHRIHKVGIKPNEEIEIPDTIKNKYAVEEDEDTQLKKAIELLKQ